MAGDFDELGFLSNAALELAELGPEDDLFRFVAEQLARLAPDSMIVAVAYEPDARSVVVRAVVGPEDMLRAARSLTGEPVGQAFPMDEQTRQLVAEGRLLRLEEGMHQLTSRTWPVALARTLESELGVKSVYGQTFFRKGDYLGAVSFINRTPSLDHQRLIEVFVRLAAVAIQRRRAEAQVRQSERRFRMLAENSQDAIFRLRLRPTLAFEYVSPSTRRLTGRAPEELYADARLGTPCLYPEQWTSAPPLRELAGQPVVGCCHHKNGAPLWTEQKFTPVRDDRGLIVAVEGISRDITQRKQAEDALIEADRRKTEFLAVLSHELRNPLGAIGSGAHVLARIEPGGPQAKRVQAMIERQIAQLTRLIDDLLDVTRITRGKIELQRERVELGELVHVTVEDHRAVLQTAMIDVEESPAPSGVFVVADRARIRQVLDNLLHNAEKFTPPGGRTSVSLRTDAAHGQAVLRVHNTGTHIPPHVLKNLFQPFVQADQTLARGKGGLGLGLALVKGIVALHEGTVEVESDEQRGTAFTIRLPLDVSASEALHAAPEDHAAHLGERRVLVIEDNVDAAESLRDALELHGYSVALASTGPKGMETARAFKPDVVVCDIGLPEMDGYEVARAMRADPALDELPLVALSGYASPADVARSREAGFDRHVSKPPSVDVLDRVIAELVH